ncbi:rhodanese domain-containing protein CG4456-like [Chironomus tepperi]|uniref:rhodanese domain-containing protein CG4456-like n=1 Tax=Chironomus tepperi TaxID=113505 RepID=UPI00391EF043
MKIICCALFFVILINYSVQMSEIKVATYDEIKDLPNHPEKLLIDVREPHELENTGRIPTSINIPLDEVRRAFSDEITDQEFELMYGVKKPKKDDYLIFTCRTGRRSLKAINDVIPLGYYKAYSRIVCQFGDLFAKVMDALQLDSRKFNELYDREKPSLDDEIIFSCLLGGRAQKGATIAVDLGYKNVKNYRGSWTEYATKEGLKVE